MPNIIINISTVCSLSRNQVSVIPINENLALILGNKFVKLPKLRERLRIFK